MRPLALYGPSIPAALLLTGDGPDGAQVVHPAADRWWHNLRELRLASQADRLRCPDCGQRLVFVCEKVPTPYFRHYRDTEECVEESAGSRYERRAQGWLRHQLVVAFRTVLPDGTRLGCDEYLANRSSTIPVELPGGDRFTLEVVTEPQELQPFIERQEALAAEGAPLFPVFVGRRIPPAVLDAARGLPSSEGGVAPVTLVGLNADHDAAARPLRADKAHAVAAQFYGLPLLVAEPRSLLFFQPGQRYEDVSLLLPVRGLLPHPSDTVWHGRVVRAPMVPGAVRFSLRHGFYTPADAAALRQLRDLFRRRRRAGRQRVVGDGYSHPVDRAWCTKQALLEAEESRRRQAEEQERRRVAEVQLLVAEHSAREAERQREAQLAQVRRRESEAAWKARLQAQLWQALETEGTALLQGRPVAVPHEGLFAVAPPVWQGAFLAFAARAGLPFTLHHCLDWLTGRYGWAQSRPLLARESWEATACVRAFLAGAVGWGLLEQQERFYRPAVAWHWPREASAAPNQPSICLLCGDVTWHWLEHDPATGYCRCSRHNP